jgi:hypothetical protein
MAEVGTWLSIRERGLLSTSALLDLYGIEGEERRRIESCNRPDLSRSDMMFTDQPSFEIRSL